MAAILPKYKKFSVFNYSAGLLFGEIDLLFSSNLRNYTISQLRIANSLFYPNGIFQKLFLVQFRDIGMEFIEHAFLRAKRTEENILGRNQIL